MEAQASALPIPSAAVFGRADALKAAAMALILGLGLVYTTGFAHPTALHNAAHDSRHALNFPCH